MSHEMKFINVLMHDIAYQKLITIKYYGKNEIIYCGICGNLLISLDDNSLLFLCTSGRIFTTMNHKHEINK